MKPFAIFGTHPLFGDYADAIHACGGYVSRIIQNVEEPPRPEGQRLEDRLSRYHAWLDSRKIEHRVELTPLGEFTPRDGEAYVFGFRGPKLLPLRGLLKQRFGLAFETLVHPGARVSSMAALAEGVFIGAGSVIAPHASIGEFTLVNRAAMIGHDCEVGPCVNIGPSAAIASGVRVAHGAIVGINATIIDGLVIGEGSRVAAGAVVIKDVPPHVLVAGVPAVEKKRLCATGEACQAL